MGARSLTEVYAILRSSMESRALTGASDEILVFEKSRSCSEGKFTSRPRSVIPVPLMNNCLIWVQ